MSLLLPREQCRRAGDARAPTTGGCRQEQGSACGDVAEEGAARQYREGWREVKLHCLHPVTSTLPAIRCTPLRVCLHRLVSKVLIQG